MKTKLLSFAILCSLSLGTANAAIINGGFESGLSGWTANNGQVSVVSSYLASNGPRSTVNMLPTQGNAFAVLSAGNPITTLTSAPITLKIGDQVSFDWFFSANDYLPYNDFGGWSLNFLLGGVSVAANVLASVATVGDFGLTGWNSFSALSPVSGDYSLQFYSINVKDSLLPSAISFDNVVVTSVPEPGVFTLMGIGLVLIVGAVKRSNRRQAYA